MKKVLAYDPSGISRELKTPRQTSSATPLQEGNNSPSLKGCQPKVDGVVYEGGGFFKYYELEQYEEALANCKYEDGDLFNSPFQKGNIDIAETLSNLTGKWIKKITPRPPSASTPLKEGNYEIELEDGTKINIKDLDYKLIKPLIWW